MFSVVMLEHHSLIAWFLRTNLVIRTLIKQVTNCKYVHILHTRYKLYLHSTQPKASCEVPKPLKVLHQAMKPSAYQNPVSLNRDHLPVDNTVTLKCETISTSGAYTQFTVLYVLEHSLLSSRLPKP